MIIRSELRSWHNDAESGVKKAMLLTSVNLARLHEFVSKIFINSSEI